MSRYKYLEEEAKKRGKKLLIENVAIHIKPSSLEIFDKPKLIESSDHKEYTARAIIKNVPVSKFTENLNGRIYNRKLDERLINEGFAEGTLSLADHPEDDGSITRICGVWHNPRIDDKFSYGDWYLVGEHGQLIAETIKAGGKIGVSRVGFGEILEDGKTVDPDSYELQRYGDAVISPSQEVFATFENLDESIEHISESTQKQEIKEQEKNILENKNTNILLNVLENKEVKTDMSEKFIEASIRMQVKQVLKEAENSDKPVEAIKELQEVRKTIPETMVEDIVKIEACVTKLQEKVESDKIAAQTALKEKTGTLESVQKEYAIACKTIEQLKEKLEKASKIVEKVSNPEMEKSIKMMEADINQFAKDRKLMEADIKHLLEDVKNMSADIKVYEEDTQLRDKDIAKFKEERKTMKLKIKNISKQLEKAEKHIEGLEKVLEDEFDYGFEDEIIDDSDYVDYNEFDDNDVNNDYFEAEDNDGDGLTGNDDIDDSMLIDEAEDDDDEDKDEMEEAEDDDDEKEDKEDAEEDEKKESVKKKYQTSQKKVESKQVSKSEPKKESKQKIVEAVQQFYQEQVRKTPALRDIRGAIMGSSSLSEAVEKVQRFKQRRFGNDTLKLSESSKKTNQYVDYVFDPNSDD
jgi:hypothetical protein